MPADIRLADTTIYYPFFYIKQGGIPLSHSKEKKD
jgi:hypothetical protein